MFTGIIEKVGKVKNISSSSITIEEMELFAEGKRGDSVAVNGVCLTITSKNETTADFEIMESTRKLSNLKNLKADDKVNLERALLPTTRMGGHYVQGHIDGVGKVKSVKKLNDSTLIEIIASAEISGQLVKKGSIALDGISLTVSELTGNTFTVSLISTTLNDTILGLRNVGDEVNIELDIIGKYVSKFVNKENKGVSESLLRDSGFM